MCRRGFSILTEMLDDLHNMDEYAQCAHGDASIQKIRVYASGLVAALEQLGTNTTALPGLKELVLGVDTEHGLFRLAPRLESVSFNTHQFAKTARALPKTLLELEIRSGWNATKGSVEELRKALPRCTQLRKLSIDGNNDERLFLYVGDRQ